jgi:uncharacterized protein YuzE
MDKSRLRVRYDNEADILYVLIGEGTVKDTVEVVDDVYVEYAEDNSIAGIEIWRASQNIIDPIAVSVAKKIRKISPQA